MFSSTERGVRRASDATNNHSTPNQTYGEHPASGPAPSTAGHHKHDILNKLDPRVDSTMDHQPVATMAAAEGVYENSPHHNSHSATHPSYDHHTTTGAGGLGESMHGAAGAPSHNYDNRQHHILPEGTYGPTTTHDTHHSNSTHHNLNSRMNDPNADVPIPQHTNTDHHKHRHGFHHGVDVATNASTVTASGTGHGLGAVGTGRGSHGSHGNTHLPKTSGGSRFADGTGTHPGAGLEHHHAAAGAPGNVLHGGVLPGPAPHTAGPHKSDLLNKLDPRVDEKGHF